MRVPVEITVGGHKVAIIYLDELTGDDDEEIYGDTTSNGKRIRISKTRHKSEREVFDTLYHEIHHSGMALTGLNHLLDKTEEAVVSGLETSTSHLFCFNVAAPGIKWKEIEFPFEE